MLRHHLGRRRVVICIALGAGLGLSEARGQSQPIQSPQDAACRREAEDRVFSTPDPQDLGIYALGRQIYVGCMARSGGGARKVKAAWKPRRDR